jgi:hypothetical protein
MPPLGTLGTEALMSTGLARSAWFNAGPWAVVVAVMPALTACTSVSRPSTGSMQPADTIVWTAFRWRGVMMGERVVERAVLQVPIHLPNAPDSLFLQLDTGSDQSMLYEVPYRELRPDLPVVLPRFVFERAAIGAAALDGDTLWLRPKSGRPIAATRARTVGTLGADLLRRRVLIIDFPARRFALLAPHAALPAELGRQARWAPLTARNGKLFVRATVGGMERDDLFFDSGSSAFPLVVRREIWRAWTGRQPADSANDVWMATSWGRDVPLIGAPLRGSLIIGGMEFRSPTTFFHGDTAGPPGFFETSSYPVSGYVGNALFADSVTVVIDVPGARFGLIVGRRTAGASGHAAGRLRGRPPAMSGTHVRAPL